MAEADPALLTLAEFQSLKDLSLGSRLIPEEHKAKLISLGYIKDTPGGPALTQMGELRLAVGNMA